MRPGLARAGALGTNAFKDETRLNTVSLPAGLTTIGDGAFMGCDQLQEIHFGRIPACARPMPVL